jgi:hypothetical protein
MEKETKIVLALRDDKALYLFKREASGYTTTEFVVGYTIGSPNIGDFVDGWANGHYFMNLEDAARYLRIV